MPPPEGKKKKKGRAPKHQNGFAFRHNPKSKKTDKILASPNVGVCGRCHEKIEWRKKYRKYKPRSQPGKCNLCFQKNVLAAYHTMCSRCSTSEKAIIAMENHHNTGSLSAAAATTTESTEAAPSADNNDSSNEGGGDAAVTESTTTTPAVSFEEATPTTTPQSTKPKRRAGRVCAICASEPAMSRYSNASGEDGDIIDKIHDLENSLESGEHVVDGHMLTLREKKGVERKIEKLQLELKQRRTKAAQEEEGGGGEEENDGEEDQSDGEEDESEEEDVDSVGEDVDVPMDQMEDPFLAATGGKALVGDDYQKMLLAREQQK